MQKHLRPDALDTWVAYRPRGWEQEILAQTFDVGAPFSNWRSISLAGCGRIATWRSALPRIFTLQWSILIALPALERPYGASFQPEGAVAVNAKSMNKSSVEARRRSRGSADLRRLRRMTEAQIARTSPPELADLPADFWQDAEMVLPVVKRAISLRVEQDVLEWFRGTGPRYLTRMNAVLRSYVSLMRKRHSGKKGGRAKAP